jgi:hypothetical protein
MLLSTALLAGVACQGPVANTGYAGAWVLEADDRPLMVLTLREERGVFRGSFATPAWNTSDGIRFEDIVGPAEARPVATVWVNSTSLRIAVTDPDDAMTPDEFDLHLAGSNHLSVEMLGSPFPPWTFVRHPETPPPSIPTGWARGRSYAIAVSTPLANPVMTAIFEADQVDRAQGQEGFQKQAGAIAVRDAARRAETRSLLDAGELKAGQDYRRAAFIFQHGTTSEDFLLAHTLAIVGLAKGDAEAGWIAAASLDRYLRSIDQPVIFGTGFVEAHGTLMVEEPFDRRILPETLRRELGVRPLAEWADDYRALASSQTPPHK